MRAALVMTLAFTPLAAAADKFPPADQLPSRPELPDPLVTQAGVRVVSAAQWDNIRKQELKELFQHYMRTNCKISSFAVLSSSLTVFLLYLI